MSIRLREYQRQIVTDLRIAYASGSRAPLLVAPTGSGKTVVLVYIADSAAKRGKNTLILVHRKELIDQTIRTLDAFGVGHSSIRPGVPFKDADVQVASVQTLVRRLEKIRWTPDLIVVDEAHHATSNTSWGRILAHHDTARLLGVTATPQRLDGRGLCPESGGFFDRLVAGPSVDNLVAAGFLSPPEVYAPSQIDLSGVHTRMGDFVTDELAAAMDKPKITGDAIDHYRKHCPGEPTLCFCVSVAHAEHTAEAFRAAGISAASIDGTLANSERAQRIEDLSSGAVNVLTSCDIVSEGTDIPVVSAAILLRPTQSLGLYLQQVGRSLRPFPGKTRALILDHVGNCLRHGLPNDEREWTLEGRKKNSREKTESPVLIRQCERCYFVHRPAAKCPKCGYEYPCKKRVIEEVSGELIKVDPAEVRKIRAREQGKAKSIDDLREIASKRGYKPGWAEYVWKARNRKRGVTS